MGTHDETNIAGPQNEFLSGFKRRAISREKETQPSCVPQTGNIGGGIASRKLSSGLLNQAGTSSGLITKQASKNIQTEQKSVDPFEEKTDPVLVRKLKTRLIGKESGAGGSKQKVMLIMIPILFIAMVFMFRQVLAKPPKKAKGDADNSKKTALVNKSSDEDIDWEIPDPLPVMMRDPIRFQENTQEISVQETSPMQTEDGFIHIKSIVYSSDKPSVVIGDKIVYEKQKINGVTVAEIRRDCIVFEKDGNRWTQKISDESGFIDKEVKIPETGDTNMVGSSVE